MPENAPPQPKYDGAQSSPPRLAEEAAAVKSAPPAPPLPSVSMLRGLLSRSDDVLTVYSVDANNEFRVVYVTPSLERMLGYAPDELIGAPRTRSRVLCVSRATSLAALHSCAQGCTVRERCDSNRRVCGACAREPQGTG
jgi:PAS domain-containing protein